MFTAIFADNWLREKDHASSISELIISGLCLTIFSTDHFIIPSMVIILIFLTDLEERSRELMADNFPNNSYASKSAFK